VSTSASDGGELRRHLGVFDAVVIGLESMIGAGISASLGPAAWTEGSIDRVRSQCWVSARSMTHVAARNCTAIDEAETSEAARCSALSEPPSTSPRWLVQVQIDPPVQLGTTPKPSFH